MLVTLFLISSNVYSSLEAPSKRGFSYIEIFLVGNQGVIFFAILEYGFILAWKKYSKLWNKSQAKRDKKKGSWFESNMTQDDKIKVIDLISFIFAITFLVIFNTIYCINSYILLYRHQLTEVLCFAQQSSRANAMTAPEQLIQ